MKLRLLLSVLVIGTSPSELIASPQQAPGTVSGVVRAADTAAGIPLVNVRIVGTDLGAGSDENGEFTIRGIPQGTYSLRFSAVGFQTLVVEDVHVGESPISLGVVELNIWTLRLEEVVVSPGRFTIMGAETGSRQTLSAENLRNMSWAEDITRAVSRLPGISSTDFSSKFTIRGGEADEVLITLDGMELYEPFHQRDKAGGLFSIVDIEAIGGVDLLTGGYSSEFGNRMSGVFSMRTRNVQGQPRRTTLGLSMMNARFFTQGTFSNGRGSFFASARRGMLDLTFKLVPDAEVVPKFHDALLKISYELTPKHTASLHVLEAGDKTSIDDLDEEGNFDKNETKYLNAYAWATLTSVYSPKLFSRTILYTGFVNHDRNGSFHKYEPSDKGDFLLRDKRDYSFLGLKQDWTWSASEHIGVSAGFETKQVNAVYDYDIDQQELRVDGTGTLYDYVRQEDIHLEPSGNQTGAYVSTRLKVAQRIAIEPSVRFDHFGFTGDDLVSPRIGIVFAISNRTFLRAATGRYFQSQFINDIDVNNEESTFSPAQLATHYVVGIEHQTRRGIDIRLEAYHKDMSRLTSNWVTLRDQQEMFPEQRNDNAQLILDGARADGIELFVKYDQGEKISWWFSYALARAEDNLRDIVFDAPLDKPTGWVSRPNNQRHTIYADLNYRPNQNWHLNFSFQYYEGWPRTDYTYEYLTLENGDLHFYPVEKEFNGTPYPAYHRFDVRVNRKFAMARGEVTTFLQVINLYNRENLRKFDLDTRNDDEEYSLDESGNYVPFEDNLNWFGLIPVLGASWSF